MLSLLSSEAASSAGLTLGEVLLR